MANNTYPVLCGGTFFTLILVAKREGPEKRSQYAGKLNEFSQPEALAGLGRVVYPEYEPSRNKRVQSTNATAYRSCENDGPNLSFLKPLVVSAFDNRIKTDYPSALKAMDVFVGRFLETGTSAAKEVWLVKALLDLIDSDQSIDDDQEFFIVENGQGVIKAALRGMNDFCLQTFLLGVLHFVVVSRPDNKEGKGTFDLWCPSSGNRMTREYEGNMGSGITRPINVTVLEIIDGELEQEAAAVEDEASSEYDEPFVDDTTDNSDSKTKNQTVNNPLVFNQYGSNSIQIGSIGTITINNSGGGKNE